MSLRALAMSVMTPPRHMLVALAVALCLVARPAAALPMPAGPPKSVSGPEISMLIRSTIVALHQANLTGNYSVLHDLGDSRFQATFAQAQLADMFRAFRERGISLAPAVLYDAELANPPVLTEDGLLRVVGAIPTTPEQIVFDITFYSEGGVWRIDAINAGTQPAPVATISNKTFESVPDAAPKSARSDVTPVLPMPRLVRNAKKLLGATASNTP
jgi:hypothetical protein